MGEPQQSIAVAGATPFAFVLAGLLAADHGRKVFVVAETPSAHAVPPPPSFALAPVTRPETLHLATVNAPDMMRRIGRAAPESIERTDVVIRATTAYHATALSHFRHLAAGFGQVVERLAGAADGQGMTVRIRDTLKLSPRPYFENVRAWASNIGLEWVAPDALTVRRNGTAALGDTAIDQVVLADDEAILRHLDETVAGDLGVAVEHMAYVAERGHGVGVPALAVPDGVLLNPRKDSALSLYADNSGGLAEARVAACLPDGAAARRAATRRYRVLRSHDGAPLIGMPRRSRVYIAAGLGTLDIALAPVIARHICGKAHGFEAEWCGLRSPGRDMTGSIVADIASGAAA